MSCGCTMETGFQLDETVMAVGVEGADMEVVDSGSTEIVSTLPRTLVITGAVLVGAYALWRWFK